MAAHTKSQVRCLISLLRECRRTVHLIVLLHLRCCGVQLDSVLRFLKALLCSDPQERMTATVAMSDPWLTFDGHVPIECSPLELAAPAARPGRRFSHRSPSASTNSRFSTRYRRSVARRSMHSRRSSASSRRSSKSPRPQTSKARKCVIQ